MIRMSERMRRYNLYRIDELWAAMARLGRWAPKRQPKPSPPTTHLVGVLIDDLRLAKAQRAMFERQAEQAYARYSELKQAEFSACERIARAKLKLETFIDNEKEHGTNA